MGWRRTIHRWILSAPSFTQTTWASQLSKEGLVTILQNRKLCLRKWTTSSQITQLLCGGTRLWAGSLGFWSPCVYITPWCLLSWAESSHWFLMNNGIVCVCVCVCVCWEREEVAYCLLTWPKPSCSPTANSCLLVPLSFLLAVFPHHINCLSLLTQLFPLAPVFETGWGLMVWDRSGSVSWRQTEVHKARLYCPSSLSALCPWSFSPQGTPEPLPAGRRHTGLSSQGRAPHS